MSDGAVGAARRRAVLEARLERAGLRGRRIPRRAGSGPVRPSFAQQRLWLLDQLSPGSPLYGIPQILRLRGELDERALEASLRRIVDRHESLRTRFVSRGGVPAQVVEPAMELELARHDLSAEADVEAALEARLRREARQGFDLDRLPLLRVGLWRLGERDHALMLNVHHIVYDGWSAGVVATELAELYAAHRSGREANLPDLEIQYADYAEWQRDELRGERLERMLGFWRERLAGAPTLELPADHPRPPVQRFAGAYETAHLPSALTDRVADLARREGCTTFHVLTAAVAILLARYSGQRDIVLGVAVANRERAEVAGLVGCFVNSLPLRFDLSGEVTFGELLEQVRSRSLEALSHQDLPFERLVEELQPERDLSRNPVFQVMVAYQNNARSEPALVGLDVEQVMVDSGTSRFDLTFNVEEFPNGWRVIAQYSTDLYERGRVQRAQGHLRRLLEEGVADASRSVWELPLLTDGERAELLELGRGAGAASTEERCLHQLFEERAARHPASVAVLFPALSSGEAGDRELSYGELNGRANQLARHLRGRGVGPGVRVGIVMERSPEMIVAQLGVLKAGGVYVPMSPENPRERLEYLFGDTRPAVVLTQERLVGELPSGVPVLSLDTGWGIVSGESPENLAGVTTVDSPMVVIYTSGSTGAPKGTVLGHRGYVNLLAWYRERMGLDEHTRYLLILSFAFDAALKDIMGTLLNGGCLVLGPARYADPATLVALIERHGVTHQSSTPTLLYPIVDGAAEGGFEKLRTMRCINVGGEATHVSRVRPWFESERCQSGFLHVYGPTECSDVITARGPMRGRELTELERLPIGAALPGVRVYVLDGRDELQPLGVPGELCAAGVLLAQGYHDRPGLTAERFAVDPFVPGQRMYRTGDVARWRADGELELLGRVDRQVKIRGLRIELGEIETLLNEHPSVRDAVVTVHEAADGDRRLVAYVVGAAAVPPSAVELREHLRQRLPEYMVPSAFVELERLPMLTIGKVDLQALPAPDYGASSGAAAPARTTLEESLVGVWSDVLQVDRIGVDDNFFLVGGHSLLATQVIAQVRDLFQVDLPLQTLFEAPTIAAFAGRLLAAADERERVERVAEVLVSVSRLSEEDLLKEG